MRTAADNGKTPHWTGQRVVNDNTCQDTRRGFAREEGRRYSAEGAPDASGEAGRLEQQGRGGEGVDDPTPYAPQKGFVSSRGGVPPSTE